MNNKLGSVIGTVGDIANSAGFTPAEFGKTFIKQIAPRIAKEEKLETPSQKPPQQEPGKVQEEADKHIREALYKPSEQQQALVPVVSPEENTTAGTDGEKLAETRAELQAHKERHNMFYFKPTFEEPVQQQATVAEQLERKKQIEDFEEEKRDAKKPPPLAIQMASNKTERFPGASG